MKKKVVVGGVFQKALACFDTKAEFARQVGLKDRQLVTRWIDKLGYIPMKWAPAVALATGGRVSALELINEANRIMQRRAIEREAIKAAQAEIHAPQEGAE